MKRACFLTIALCLLSSVFVLVPADSAYAYSYSRTKAVAYAMKYTCDGGGCRNAFYAGINNDCTNFASQVLRAGGIPVEYKWNPFAKRWFFRSLGNRSKSWTSVKAFRQYHVVDRKRAVYWTANKKLSTNAARKGDLYLYDWGTGDGYSHLAVSTGWGRYGGAYSRFGSGDYMNQHSTDREKAPWNYGWRTEGRPKVRNKMKIVIIHIK